MGVTGIGGFFFQARDPEALASWYRERLGIGLGEYGMWDQQAGPTVFSPADAAGDTFLTDRAWRINFRVDGLEALVDALRSAGIDVMTDPEWDAPGVGRFARLHDPEGNPIELWEPD